MTRPSSMKATRKLRIWKDRIEMNMPLHQQAELQAILPNDLLPGLKYVMGMPVLRGPRLGIAVIFKNGD